MTDDLPNPAQQINAIGQMYEDTICFNFDGNQCFNNFDFFVASNHTSSLGGGIFGLGPTESGGPPSMASFIALTGQISSPTATIVLNNFYTQEDSQSSLTFGGAPADALRNEVDIDWYTHKVVSQNDGLWKLKLS